MTSEVRAYVRSALPPAPARVLEVGAGSGELAADLRAAGYDVVAIDPAGGEGVAPVALLAAVLRDGARLVVDEFDVDAYDEDAARWWLSHTDRTDDPAALVADLRGHLHALAALREELGGWFELGEPVRGAYLY